MAQKNIFISANTVYKYMKSLGLRSVTRREYVYKKGKASKLFLNLINRNFTADKPNQKWCTDFTYLPLTNGKTIYNCSIIDLYDRRIVASVNGMNITSELAEAALKEALFKERISDNLILHSDQGSQFTSDDFSSFCRKNGVIQSMFFFL